MISHRRIVVGSRNQQQRVGIISPSGINQHGENLPGKSQHGKNQSGMMVMTIGINLHGINPNGILMMIGISLLGSMNGGDGQAAAVVVHHHRVNQERAGPNLAVVAVVHPQVIGTGMVPRGRVHRVGMNQSWSWGWPSSSSSSWSGKSGKSGSKRMLRMEKRGIVCSFIFSFS